MWSLRQQNSRRIQIMIIYHQIYQFRTSSMVHITMVLKLKELGHLLMIFNVISRFSKIPLLQMWIYLNKVHLLFKKYPVVGKMSVLKIVKSNTWTLIPLQLLNVWFQLGLPMNNLGWLKMIEKHRIDKTKQPHEFQ